MTAEEKQMSPDTEAARYSLEDLFKAAFNNELADTDIEDPKAARRYAAEAALSELTDRLGDIFAVYYEAP